MFTTTTNNPILWCALLLVAAIAACSTQRDEAKPPRTQNDIVNIPPPTAHFYTHVTDFSGRSIPHSKLPSTLIDDKLIDVCEQGQVPFLDHCYDAVHLNDRVAGFRLESPTKSFVVAETADNTLLSALQRVGSFIIGRHEFTTALYAHRTTFNCKAVKGRCRPPSLLNRGLSVTQINSHNYIDHLTLDTSFVWGGDYQHAWAMRGTITMNGKVHLLPLTRAQVKRAYGNQLMGDAVRHGYVTTKFTFADTYPASEQVLTSVNYRVDNYARAAALRLNNSAEAVQ